MSRILTLVSLLASNSALAGPPATCADDAPRVMAKVGGETITSDMVDAAIGSALARARMSVYEARAEALDSLVDSQLLEQEARRRAITVDALLVNEVSDQVLGPTDDEIAAFYELNQQRIGLPLDEARELIRARMRQQQEVERFDAFVSGLRAANPPKIRLESPRFRVAGSGPRLGPASAPVEVVVFSDFQCPYCRKGADIVRELHARYGKKVAITFRHFPLEMHPDAEGAAAAAVCADVQGRFWEMHDVLFANQGDLTFDRLPDHAKSAGIPDLVAFGQCLASPRPFQVIERDERDGDAVGMTGTPGFYINGLPIAGARPVESFAEIIDRELAR